MFIKIFFPEVNAYFPESGAAPMLGNTAHGGVTRFNDLTWVALDLVPCAHPAALAALRPQSRSLPLETGPEPIMVSWLGAAQATPQNPTLPAKLIAKAQKPVRKQVKPINKPALPRMKQASLSGFRAIASLWINLSFRAATIGLTQL